LALSFAHGFEFRPYWCCTLFDYMAEECETSFDFEMDVYWGITPALGPPLNITLKISFSKFILMHLKDMEKSTKKIDTASFADVETNVVLVLAEVDIAGWWWPNQGKLGIKYMF